MGHMQIGEVVPPFVAGGQPFQRNHLPFSQYGSGHLIRTANLHQRLFFLDQFQDDLGVEGGSAHFFHGVCSLSFAALSVRIP